MALRKLKPLQGEQINGESAPDALLSPVHWRVRQNPKIRLDMPEERWYKFEPILLYLLKQMGKKHNTETALQKLLYFIDFDYYEKFEEQLIGARYIKNEHGPTSSMFYETIAQLAKENIINCAKSKNHRQEGAEYFLAPAAEIDISALTKQEIKHVDWEINRLKCWNIEKLSALSHLDTPWLVAEENESLEYEYVFYRPNETSVGEYDEL